MPRKLDPAVKADREKAAADKKMAAAAKKAAAEAKKATKAKAAAEKKMKGLEKLMTSEVAKLASGKLTPSHAHVVQGRVRALTDRIREAAGEYAKFA